jgi:hypothetical protein
MNIASNYDLYKVDLVMETSVDYSNETVKFTVTVGARNSTEAKKLARDLFATNDRVMNTISSMHDGNHHLGSWIFMKDLDTCGISFTEFCRSERDKLSQTDIDELIQKGTLTYGGLPPSYEIDSDFDHIIDFKINSNAKSDPGTPDNVFNYHVLVLVEQWMVKFVECNADTWIQIAKLDASPIRESVVTCEWTR